MAQHDLAPPRPLNATTDDTGPALLIALLSEVKAAKLVDLAPTVLATHDEELRSLLPPEWETAPGTVGPAATGPTATLAVLRRPASGSAARGAWQPSDGPRLNARSRQRKEAMQQNIRWSDGDPQEALRRRQHTPPRVIVHSVQYRGEAKAAPPHRNTAAHREERSDPRPMVFNNPTVVASRILSEHARAVCESERKSRSPAGARHRLVGSTAQLHHLATPHRLASSQMMMMMLRARACGLRQAPSALTAPPTPRPSPQNNARVVPAGARRRPASARAAQRMPDDLATRMQEAGLPKRYLHALRGMGFVYVEQLLALGRSLSLTERYVEVSGGPRSCTAPPLDQVLDTTRSAYTLAALTTPATPHVLHCAYCAYRTHQVLDALNLAPGHRVQLGGWLAGLARHGEAQGGHTGTHAGGAGAQWASKAELEAARLALAAQLDGVMAQLQQAGPPPAPCPYLTLHHALTPCYTPLPPYCRPGCWVANHRQGARERGTWARRWPRRLGASHRA